MAKRKKRSSRKVAPKGPQHVLPDGFWPQVSAVILILLALLLALGIFQSGGPFPETAYNASKFLLGNATYIIPILFVYRAVQIFRAENNRIPAVVTGATVLFVVFFAGFLQLMTSLPADFDRAQTGTGGGVIGWIAGQGALGLVNAQVGALVFLILLLITSLFVLAMSPQSVIDKITGLFKRDDTGRLAGNRAVAERAAKLDNRPTAVAADFKLNEGVPTMMSDDKQPGKLSSLRGSTKPDKAAEAQAALTTSSDPDWEAPSVDLLEGKQNPADAGDVKHNAQIIKDTLNEFSIDVDMEGANIGPKVTQYTLKPPSGVKLTKITALETNLALNLAAQAIRIEAPIPGQRAVGIEVPNLKAADVRIRGILESKQWSSNYEPLSFAVGKDISGEAVVGELNKMPHLLVAGQTNSGKSVMINTLLCSLLYRNSPSQMKLILVDPKQVEMARYQDIPHLLTPIITDPEKTVSALKWAVNEMERRYKLLAEIGELNIKDYNDSLGKKRKTAKAEQEEPGAAPAEDGAMPYIVIIIDEMADLMMVASRDVEALIVRLAQKARAIGIHLVLATQSPRADVITGLIKANVPAKIAFTVGNQLESRIIMDQTGAEKLLGQGDMLYKTATMSKPIRVQGAWVMNDEVKKIADHLRMQRPPQYNDEIVSQPVQLNGKGGVVMDFDGGSEDSLYNDAVRAVVEGGKASTSYLQRRLRVGYSRAARLMEEMEEQGVIGPADGARPRDVLITNLDEIGSE